jgi:phosphatidate phosphatase APP1
VLRAEGTDPVEARIFVISPDTRLGIVSDIDDTIMVTALPRPFLALWNTFVLNERARMATPGMAVLMDRLKVEHPEAPVIYLSTGPWNAAPTLARFPLPPGRAAAHGLGADAGPLVPQRPGTQTAQP